MIRLALALCLLACPALARPNFVVVTIDDATVAAVGTAMPLTRAIIGGHGVTFDRALVEDALCAPSRATFFTGQYAHNHGVHVCDVPQPDSGDRAMKLVEGESLAVWLNRVGYQTGLAGKYMNGYARSGVQGIPPGWSEWAGFNGGGTFYGFNYRLNENGVNVTYGTAQADFATDVLAHKAISFIQRNAGGQPWFFYLAPPSGHAPCDYPDRHAGLYAGVKWPGPVETDVTDKPPVIRALSTSATSSTLYNKCLRSLASADEAVRDVWNTIVDTGQADNTWLVLWSDNGFHFGEHRLPSGKNSAYEVDERVSMMARGPGVAIGHESRLVGNVDLAPTILELAGVSVPASVDGTSLTPLLMSRATPWRTAFPVWHQWASASQQKNFPDYHAVRTEHWKWVEWSNGQRELYHLDNDPDELTNVASDPATQDVRDELTARVAALANCRGARCRGAER